MTVSREHHNEIVRKLEEELQSVKKELQLVKEKLQQYEVSLCLLCTKSKIAAFGF